MSRHKEVGDFRERVHHMQTAGHNCIHSDTITGILERVIELEHFATGKETCIAGADCLIAAAPDLLATCKWILEDMWMVLPEDMPRKIESWHTKLTEVIAKADPK